MAKLLCLIVLLTFGCGQNTWDEPTTIVWEETFKATGLPPTVEFVYDSVCQGRQHTFEYNGKCYLGLYFYANNFAIVEWLGSHSKSAFAHELLHAWQSHRGITDYLHENEEWRIIVPLANENLLLRGY